VSSKNGDATRGFAWAGGDAAMAQAFLAAESRELQLAALLNLLSSLNRAMLSAARSVSVSGQSIEIVATLCVAGGQVSLAELAKGLRREPQSIAESLKRLEKDGMVNVLSYPDDFQ
jgi:DNA-binding MarR family transcriptional regulator